MSFVCVRFYLFEQDYEKNQIHGPDIFYNKKTQYKFQ